MLDHVESIELFAESGVAYLHTDGLFDPEQCPSADTLPWMLGLCFRKLTDDAFSSMLMLTVEDGRSVIPELLTEENEVALSELFVVTLPTDTGGSRTVAPTVQLVPRYYRKTLCIGAVSYPVTPCGEQVRSCQSLHSSSVCFRSAGSTLSSSLRRPLPFFALCLFLRGRRLLGWHWSEFRIHWNFEASRSPLNCAM
jgi:hypothetical protein